MSDDFSGCKPPMRHIAGINVDMLRRGGAAPQPAPQGASSKLLHRAMEQLYAWSKKYGEHQPAWLPPAGDVTLCEDIAEYIARRSVPAPQGVAEVMKKVTGYGVFCGYGQDDFADAEWALVKQAVTAIITERDALRERVAEMERDAARYRWLRDRPGQIGMSLWPHAPWVHEGLEENQARFELCIDEELVEVIDAAIAAAKEAK